MPRFTTLVVSAVSTLALGSFAGIASLAGPTAPTDLTPGDGRPGVSLVETSLVAGSQAAKRTGNWCC